MAATRVGPVDLSGKRFGSLSVIERTKTVKERDRSYAHFWRCRCDCGAELEINHRYLTRGSKRSCGCDELPSQLKHGGTRNYQRSAEYRTWAAMLERCNSPSSASYKNYGAIGRVVCERWNQFSAFIEDMGRRPTAGHTLERIDNEKGYSPENCKWATRKEQMRNVRYNVHLTLDGRTQCVAAWAEELGLSAMKIYKRLYRGWSQERALTEP